MAGRAGRIHGGPSAQVEVIVQSDDEEYAREAIGGDVNLEAISVIGDIETMSFHILPEICAGNITDINTAETWYQRSFHAFSGGRQDFHAVFSYLRGMEAITWRSGVKPTLLGHLASSFYFHPADVLAWRDNFDQIFKQGLEDDDVAAAWALGNVPMRHFQGTFGNHWEIVDEFMSCLPSDLEVRDGCLVSSVLWWNVIGGPSVGPMRNCVLQIRKDSPRVFALLKRIDREVAGWSKDKYFDEKQFQSSRGIPLELLELCLLPGVGKSMAYCLYNVDIRSRSDVISEAGLNDLATDDEIGMAARGLADGVF